MQHHLFYCPLREINFHSCTLFTSSFHRQCATSHGLKRDRHLKHLSGGGAFRQAHTFDLWGDVQAHRGKNEIA